MEIRKKWNRFEQHRSFQEFYFFAVALILAFGTLQSAGTVMGTEKPVVSVVSCSMYPALDVGDILLVRGVDFESIDEGDIVVYSTPEMDIPVVHRVIEKRADSLETRGDNNRNQFHFEKDVRPEQILGVVVGGIPRIGAVKLVAMDFFGVGGVNTDVRNDPFKLENRYLCPLRVPLDQR